MYRLYRSAYSAVSKAKDLALNFDDLKVSHFKDDTKLNLDLELNNFFIAELHKTDIPILSEESVRFNTQANPTYWLIDPLDGSLNYSNCNPTWGISLGLVLDGVLQFSVCYSNLHRAIYSSYKGKLYKNNRRLKIIIGNYLDNERVYYTGNPTGIEPIVDFESHKKYKKVRQIGSALCSIITVVESGGSCLYEEKGIFIWDVWPAILIADSAGFSCTYIELKDFRTHTKVDI